MTFAWMNGQVIRVEELKISPFDHGFLYGIGFFETFRTYRGKIFLFSKHMERLRKALADYRIVFPYKDDDIIQAVEQLQLRSEHDGYFRLNVSAGEHGIGLAPTHYPSPNVILLRKELTITNRQGKHGIWLQTPRNTPESMIRHKSHNFLNNVKGRLELPSLQNTEGIFLTSTGFVAEGVTSNIFWSTNGKLFTPSVSTGILPGVTRSFVIHLASIDNIPIQEGCFRREEVEQADEVFITNAVQELVPLTSIGEKALPGSKGDVYQHLHRKYKQAIEAMHERDDKTWS